MRNGVTKRYIYRQVLRRRLSLLEWTRGHWHHSFIGKFYVDDCLCLSGHVAIGITLSFFIYIILFFIVSRVFLFLLFWKFHVNLAPYWLKNIRWWEMEWLSATFTDKFCVDDCICLSGHVAIGITLSFFIYIILFFIVSRVLFIYFYLWKFHVNFYYLFVPNGLRYAIICLSLDTQYLLCWWNWMD